MLMGVRLMHSQNAEIWYKFTAVQFLRSGGILEQLKSAPTPPLAIPALKSKFPILQTNTCCCPNNGATLANRKKDGVGP